MALFVITAFIHGMDGLKVVVDDYVHETGNNVLLNGLILFAGIGGAALALFSLAKIAFGAAAA
jgi:succinate dehydrogenase / fumarate reductase membrane anchor subunit